MERILFYGTDMEKQLKAEDGQESSKKLWHHIQREKKILMEKLEAIEIKEFTNKRIPNST